MSDNPFVTIVVPCRNEHECIRRTLAALSESDYPHDRFEILVVDGMSTDGTRDLVRDFAATHSAVRMLDNPKRNVPAAMNVGISNAQGDIILKADAHAGYPADFVRECVRYLLQYEVDNVGGVCEMAPMHEGVLARAIALVLAHPLAAGNAPHVCPRDTEPHLADTAAFGCYRKEVFDRIGLYNEEIVRSSDMDLNVRLRRAGGKILLVPRIVLQYYPLPRFTFFVERQFMVGYWVIYGMRFGGRAARIRHLVPMSCLLTYATLLALGAATPSLFGPALDMAALYGAVVLGASGQITFAQRDLRLLPYLLPLFVIRHWVYAAGSVAGLARAAASQNFWTALFTGVNRRIPSMSRSAPRSTAL